MKEERLHIRLYTRTNDNTMQKLDKIVEDFNEHKNKGLLFNDVNLDRINIIKRSHVVRFLIENYSKCKEKNNDNYWKNFGKLKRILSDTESKIQNLMEDVMNDDNIWHKS